MELKADLVPQLWPFIQQGQQFHSEAFRVWRWSSVAVVAATIAATHGRGQRSTAGLLPFTYKCVTAAAPRLHLHALARCSVVCWTDEFWKSVFFFSAFFGQQFYEPFLRGRSLLKTTPVTASFRSLF